MRPFLIFAALSLVSCAAPEPAPPSRFALVVEKPHVDYVNLLPAGYSFPPRLAAISSAPRPGRLMEDDLEDISGFAKQLRGLNPRTRRMRLAEPVPMDLYTVISGGAHSCALKKSFKKKPSIVKCWGYNGYGQIGEPGSVSASNTPAAVSGLPGKIVSLTAGMNHTCALGENGDVYCWGDNSSLQLGSKGATISYRAIRVPGFGAKRAKKIARLKIRRGKKSAPAPIKSEDPRVVDLSAGAYHTCARLESREVVCWGANVEGQLGIGKKSARELPTKLTSLSNVSKLSAGFAHQCAILSSGEAKCWGLNTQGQLGLGNTDDSNSPASITGLARVDEIAAGFYHTCARKDDSIYCWGLNSHGQFGSPASTDEPVLRPKKTELAGISNIAMGWATGFALRGDRLVAWGDNEYFEATGSPLEGRRITTPAALPLSNVVSVSAGLLHACAVAQNKLWCWGDNTAGQLGSGDDMEGSWPFRLVVF